MTPEDEVRWKQEHEREEQYQRQLNSSAARSLFQESLESLGFSRTRAQSAVVSDTFREIFFDSLSLANRIQGWILEPARRRANVTSQKMIDAIAAGENSLAAHLQAELQGLFDVLPDAEAATRVALIEKARETAKLAFMEAQGLRMAKIIKDNQLDTAEFVMEGKSIRLVKSEPDLVARNKERTRKKAEEQAAEQSH